MRWLSLEEELLREKYKKVINALCDYHGIVRPDRVPDYLYGRWCARCHNSLPEDWSGPCDVCGADNKVDLSGLYHPEQKQEDDDQQDQTDTSPTEIADARPEIVTNPAKHKK